jgi:adenylosuccinate lyase
VQFFERTLDDSANRRLVLPEAFLATDAILVLMSNVAAGLRVNVGRVRERVARELPFMATEEFIVRAVRAGGDRQRVHETIRRHSLAAARAMANGADRNDLFERLETDDEFQLDTHELRDAAEPRRFVGRAPEQVDEFLAEVVEPLLSRAGSVANVSAELRV